MIKSSKAPGHLTAKTEHTSSLEECIFVCLQASLDKCQAVNYKKSENLCRFLSTTIGQNYEPFLEPNDNWDFLAPVISGVPRSCSDALERSGRRQSGKAETTLIDPDGEEGPVAPFFVHCDNTTGTVWTKLTATPYDSFFHGNNAAGGIRKSISYLYANMDQIVSLISMSTRCQQKLKYTCFKASFMSDMEASSLKTWWVSRDGEKMMYWAGGPSDGRGCACGVTQTCASNSNIPRSLCNCNMNDGVWRTDEGYITDKTKLPVSELRVGDVGDHGEYGFGTVWPLECTGLVSLVELG
ncbi:contactin-associated protein-like 2 [Lingula anatina]|uniref:Contactin-associated protein-like 2 n=1 Tax=Lingula anatina TaxID=7574 RepID=A0A1S3KEG7_LINAN|nr:contactin-associated protein-like 2 [Lingula anatina]|eukprot:XP_013420849.1 contactin-associated protein-like 2 [Lingula anatina]